MVDNPGKEIFRSIFMELYQWTNRVNYHYITCKVQISFKYFLVCFVISAQVMSKLVFLSHDQHEVTDHISWLRMRTFCNFYLNFELFLKCCFILLLTNTSVFPWKTLKIDISWDFNRIYTRLRQERDGLLLFIIITLVDQQEVKRSVAFFYKLEM